MLFFSSFHILWIFCIFLNYNNHHLQCFVTMFFHHHVTKKTFYHRNTTAFERPGALIGNCNTCSSSSIIHLSTITAWSFYFVYTAAAAAAVLTHAFATATRLFTKTLKIQFLPISLNRHRYFAAHTHTSSARPSSSFLNFLFRCYFTVYRVHSMWVSFS